MTSRRQGRLGFTDRCPGDAQRGRPLLAEVPTLCFWVLGVFHSGSGAVLLAPSTSPLLGWNHVFARDVTELCLQPAPDPGEEPLMLCTRLGAPS